VQEKIKHIKDRLQLLVKQYQHLQKENAQLKAEVEKSNTIRKQQQQTIEELKYKIDTAKIQSSQLSREEKAALEKRIDGYLKEINMCLNLLSKE
jgi:chromosome segregation ATPase